MPDYLAFSTRVPTSQPSSIILQLLINNFYPTLIRLHTATVILHMGKVSKDTGDKKEPPSAGSQPQTRKSSVSKDVNITKYLDSRAAELAHFESILQNKFKESTRTPMQTVPKHMRRRA